MNQIQAGILAVLTEAEASPREDILWECSVSLLNLIGTPSGLQELCKLDFARSPIAHSVTLRALGHMYGCNDQRLELIVSGLDSDSTEVRDAAVSALVDLGDSGAIPWLQDRFGVETSPLIREAITDAISELRES